MELLVFIKVLLFLCITNASGLSESKLGFFHKSSIIQSCPNSAVIELSEPEGIISSPFYPNSYPHHVSCSWHILGNTGDIITVTLEDIDIEESCCCESKPCCFNWLKIGPLANGTEKKYCGKDFNHYHIVTSNSNKLWIKFHISQYKNGARGFRFHYKIGPPSKCHKLDFRCPDNKCLPSLMRCNGYPDCLDGSDEFDCSNRCASGRSCHTVFQCYEASKRCDGIADCEDLSDEADCFVCPPNLTRCGLNSTQCYDPQTQRCDKVLDCLNGEDEVDCSVFCSKKILCDSQRGCYAPRQRCNGITQCEDASDERNCVSELCNYEHGGFLCSNGRCIQEVWTCDRTDDCGDGSDERNCLRNSVLTAALMGSLVCALLLVIAISCTCRLHALRMLENRLTSTRETPLSRLSREFFFREPPPSYAASVQGDPHRGGLCVENLHYGVPVHRSRRRQRRLRYVRVTQRPPPPGYAAATAATVQSPAAVPDAELLDDTLPVTDTGTSPEHSRAADKPEDVLAEVGGSKEPAVAKEETATLPENVSLETLSSGHSPEETSDHRFYCDSDVDPLVV